MKNPMMEPVFFTEPSGKESAPRRLHKGGGGGDPNAYARERDAARKSELEKFRREMGISSAPRQSGFAGTTIDGLPTRESAPNANPIMLDYWDSLRAEEQAARDGVTDKQAQREANYQKIYKDVLGFHMPELERQAEKARRQLKFSLARSGNLGGSLEADQLSEFGETRQRELANLESTATSARTGAERGDLEAIMQAESAINNGADAEGSLANALRSMANEQSRVFEQAKGAAIGSGLAGLAEGYQNRSYAQAQEQIRRALQKPPANPASTSSGGMRNVTTP